MAGITDYPFRRLARQMGCGMVFTEMVSADGLLRKGEAFLKLEKEEHPVSVQLFGANPETLAEAAERVEAAGADAVDLNMGCPAKKVIRTGAGAGLMREPEKAKRILTGMRKRLTIPFTVKIRSGWDEKQVNAIEIARIAEDCGVDAISVHPRTREQGFQGLSDWKVIREVKKEVGVPVIGNGDVTHPALVKKMKDETGCDGVMIGRGALGNPWIFREQSSVPPGEGYPISLQVRRRTIDDHFLLVLDYYEKMRATREIRKHIYWYTKGLPCCASFHAMFTGLNEEETLFGALDSYFASIEGRKR
jgi:tRNA-dihydrouridine synthase B